MLAFRVRINKKKVATAGLSGFHGLTAILSSVVRDPEKAKKWPGKFKFRKKELTFSVGGMATRKDGSDEFMDWLNINLKRGDKISIEIIETEKIDPPRKSRLDMKSEIEKGERRTLKRLKNKY